MKIYRSTEYIENPQVGDIQLEVNSMWNSKSRSVCFKTVEKTFGGGTTVIPYDLKECTVVKDSFVIGSNPPEPCKSTRWEQAEITEDIVKQLIEDGYTVSKEYLSEQYKCKSYEEDGVVKDCTCGECKIITNNK